MHHERSLTSFPCRRSSKQGWPWAQVVCALKNKTVRIVRDTHGSENYENIAIFRCFGSSCERPGIMSSRVTSYSTSRGASGERENGESNFISRKLVKSIPSMQDFMQQTVLIFGAKPEAWSFLHHRSAPPRERPLPKLKIDMSSTISPTIPYLEGKMSNVPAQYKAIS